jgi:hypothetical protein
LLLNELRYKPYPVLSSESGVLAKSGINRTLFPDNCDMVTNGIVLKYLLTEGQTQI